MQQEMNQWIVMHGQVKKQLEETDLKCIKKSAQKQTKQSPQQTPPFQLNQDKLREAQTFTNYLPPTYQTCPLQVFKFCLSFFGASLHSLDCKVKSLNQRAGLRQQKVGEMMRTSRKRLALCFSSKWRQAQKILYLIVHKFISSQKQINKVRIHILNHRGLILQTISNIHQNNYFQEISRTILRHYRRLDSVVLFLPQNNVIDLDKLGIFFKDLVQYQILVIFTQSRQSFKKQTEFEASSWKHFDAGEDVFLGLQSDNKQMLVGYNSRLKITKISYILSSLCSIIKREALTAGYLQSIDYFSGSFCQKQLYLRFYAYLFNFITLKGKEIMQSEESKSLVGEIIDLQIDSYEKMQKQMRVDNLEPLAHTYISHQTHISCLLCKKRTKTRCQKCCLQFNKLFGLCEKQCFAHFHENTQMYIQRVQKSKKVYKIKQESQESQQNEFKYQESINGRKIRKQEETNLKIDQDVEVKKVKSIQEIAQSWSNIINENQNQHAKFQSYAFAKMVPDNMFKKVEYIKQKLTEIKSTTVQISQIKVEQNLQNESI